VKVRASQCSAVTDVSVYSVKCFNYSTFTDSRPNL